MKLRPETAKKLMEIVKTASSIGIDALIIDDHSIRGISETSPILLIQANDSIINMNEVGALGIPRLKVLEARLALLSDEATIDVVYKDPEAEVKSIVSLTLKNKKTVVDFRTGNPEKIHAKKALNAAQEFEFDITKETIELMGKVNTAMKGENISFSLDNGEVQLKLSEDNGDTLKHSIQELDIDKNESFFFKYATKTILMLLKKAIKKDDSVKLKFTRRGTMHIMIDGLGVYLPPEV